MRLASDPVGAIRCRGFTRGVAQLGSALRSGRRGRGFESRHPDRVKPGDKLMDRSPASSWATHGPASAPAPTMASRSLKAPAVAPCRLLDVGVLDDDLAFVGNAVLRSGQPVRSETSLEPIPGARPDNTGSGPDRPRRGRRDGRRSKLVVLLSELGRVVGVHQLRRGRPCRRRSTLDAAPPDPACGRSPPHRRRDNRAHRVDNPAHLDPHLGDVNAAVLDSMRG